MLRTTENYICLGKEYVYTIMASRVIYMLALIVHEAHIVAADEPHGDVMVLAFLETRQLTYTMTSWCWPSLKHGS